jgi:hypothetical protein
MADPRILKIQFAHNAEARKVDVQGLYTGIMLYAPNGTEEAFRIVNRNDDVRNKNQNDLGMITFSATGPESPNGTSGLQDLARWLSGHPRPNSEFGSNYPLDGRAEIEVLVTDFSNGTNRPEKVWKNLVNGQINREIVLIDGQVQSAI